MSKSRLVTFSMFKQLELVEKWSIDHIYNDMEAVQFMNPGKKCISQVNPCVGMDSNSISVHPFKVMVNVKSIKI